MIDPRIERILVPAIVPVVSVTSGFGLVPVFCSESFPKMLRKIPSKKTGLFGLDWTLWFFPGLAIKSVYRRFAPSRAGTSRENLRYNEMMTDRWSMAYFITAWTLGGFIIYKVLSVDDPDRGGDFPGLEGAKYHAAKRLQHLDGDKKVKVFTVPGASFKSEDITNVIQQSIEEKTGYSNNTADRYEDQEYIRKRLGNPPVGSYDPIIAKHYIKRLDSQRI